MELRVDRHRGDAGVPAGEHHLDVRGAVAHRERDAVAVHESEASAQRTGDGGHAPREGAVVQDAFVADGHGTAIGCGETGAPQQMGEIHRDGFLSSGPGSGAGAKGAGV
jgi:hypothetical protein